MKNINNVQNDDDFEYDLDEAVEVVCENIPQSLREKLDTEDIYTILEIEADYMEKVGILLKEGEELPVHNYPFETDWDELQYYIISNAVKVDIFLTYDELDEILDAETMYYEMNGALGDAGEYLN